MAWSVVEASGGVSSPWRWRQWQAADGVLAQEETGTSIYSRARALGRDT
jgi:hypothetical protein